MPELRLQQVRLRPGHITMSRPPTPGGLFHFKQGYETGAITYPQPTRARARQKGKGVRMIRIQATQVDVLYVNLDQMSEIYVTQGVSADFDVRFKVGGTQYTYGSYKTRDAAVDAASRLTRRVNSRDAWK